MSVKSETLKELEKNKDNFISGQELANNIGATRSAVWKAVNTLKKEGYDIIGKSNSGYKLNKSSDVLSDEGIRLSLLEEYKNIGIIVNKVVTSTNTVGKAMVINNEIEKEIFVVLAEEQSEGKGRLGRSFVSPKGSGIYLSLVLKPRMKADNAVLITTAASVAVYRVFKKMYNIELKIKWVNDLYYNNKKVCGILTEAVTDFESGNIDCLVVGIGINIKTSDEELGEDISKTATSIFKSNEKTDRNKIAAEIINELLNIFKDLETREFLEDYRNNSLVIDKNIMFIKDGNTEYGTAVDIDKNGGLIVKTNNGITTLSTGEISVRLKK